MMLSALVVYVVFWSELPGLPCGLLGFLSDKAGMAKLGFIGGFWACESLYDYVLD